MKAIIGVLDDDLERLATQLATPLPTRTLSESEWREAEAARAAVERDLRTLEMEAAVIAVQLNDWRAKEAMAAQRGDAALAEQARLRAAETEQVYQSHKEEIGAARAFLNEWAARVHRGDPER